MDHSQILTRTQQTIEIPDWLQIGCSVKHPTFGRGVVEELFGVNVIAKFDNGKTKSVAVKDVCEDKSQTHDLVSPTSAIGESSHRQIARELSDLTSLVDVQPAYDGELEPLPATMDRRLVAALEKIGIKKLFSHQIQGFNALIAGKDIAPMTPTASGKTLTFNPGIFQKLIQDSKATALYLYPLKALATDQMLKLEEIAQALPTECRPKIGCITGDVKDDARQRMFKPTFPQILALSPDVLHHMIFKQRKDEWEQWRQYLKGLRYVVVDEAHTYIGVFGGHFANLMSRLRLAVDNCGGDSTKLQFVFATATVGNASEMISKFSGRPLDRVEIIDRSGAGSRGRTTLCLHPSYKPMRDAAEIVHLWFRYGLTGIVFVNSRAEAKSLYNTLRRELGSKHSQVAAYYGGLHERQRNDVVAGLRSGKIKAVISTSALEAGLDLPSLDACLCAGFAGSLMSHRQRIGRAGRKSPGLVIFLPYDDRSLDSYFGGNPKELLFGQVENAQFNPSYPTVLSGHIQCAATESGIPINQVKKYFGDTAKPIVDALLSQNEIQVWGDRLTGRGYPHRDVSIRGSKADTVRLIDVNNNDEEIEEMDIATAHKEAFTGAIYSAYVDGNLVRYRCYELDLKARVAKMTRFHNETLSTYAMSKTTVKQSKKLAKPDILSTTVEGGRLRLTLGWGKISRVVYGYQVRERKVTPYCRTRSCQNFDVELSVDVCPACRLETRKVEQTKVVDEEKFDQPLYTSHQAPILKIEINPNFLERIEGKIESLKQKFAVEYAEYGYPREVDSLWKSKAAFLALHSISHQLQIAMPMLVLSSQYDVDSLVVEGDEDADGKLVPTVSYLFDTVEGGNGATEEIFGRFREFAKKAKSLGESCKCRHGCPKCLLLSNCGQYNASLNKSTGLYTLGLLDLDSIVSNGIDGEENEDGSN